MEGRDDRKRLALKGAPAARLRAGNNGHKIVVMTGRARKARQASVGAAEFKARCLELMERVRETRQEYVVTKHGKPVAKLVPYDPPERSGRFFGSMRGSVLRYDRPFDPVPGEWPLDPLIAEKKKT
jgi:prevent-host-death family protein